MESILESQILRIERLANHAFGIAHAADGKVTFVAGAAPGDVVEAAFDADRGSYYEAHVVAIKEASPLRVGPACPFVESCGGCSWQHVAYEAQCTAKRAAVVDALEHIARFSEERAEALVSACRPSPAEFNYRNKLELGAATEPGRSFLLGFYREESHVLATPGACLLAHRALAGTLKALRGALSYAQGSDDLGIYRVGVRHSETCGSLEVALWTEPKTTASFPRARVAKVLADALRPSSIVRVVAAHDRMRDVRKVEVLAGKGFWEERLAGLTYYTSAPSFFQVNTAQAEVLVALVRELLGGEPSGSHGGASDCAPGDAPGGASGGAPGGEPSAVPGGAQAPLASLRVADLYAGGGTFSLPLAEAGADVVAVEAAGSSVRDLRRNAEINGLDIEVVGGDAERELLQLGALDALVVDPPRSGLAKGAVAAIAQVAPKRLVYVSCNPATWARDVARFEQAGYQLAQAHPVDLFPQTPHGEVVSLFVITKERRKS